MKPNNTQETDPSKRMETENKPKTKMKIPWIFRDNEPTHPDTIRMIVGRVLEVNLIKIFGNFCYSFGGKIYHQQNGGPTGTKAATTAAKVSMEEILEEVENDGDKKESDSSAKTPQIGEKVYVDDVRTLWFIFRPGTRYENGEFIIKKDPETLKEDENITLGELTRREVLKCMNSKSESVKFTAEKPSDFGDHQVPTLDFKIGVDSENNEFTLRFFEKPMASKHVLPAKSAMDTQTRNQIMSEDVVRKLRRMNPKYVEEESEELRRPQKIR